jgi:hypothetical protein
MRESKLYSRMKSVSEEAHTLYKQVLDTIGVIVVVVGLYFAWDQATQFNHSQNLANWSDVTARTFDMDKVFIENPELQKYFTAGADIKESEKDYPKVYAIASMMLDYFDSVMTRLDYNQNRLSDDILQRAAWNHYFKATFSESPILCGVLMADPLSYGTEMRRIGIPTCKEVIDRQSNKP